MDFNSALSIIQKALKELGTTIDPSNYDGLIVKKLVASNTLDEGRTTNQTHIAITGPQMDIFPYLCADGYFYKDGKIADADLKKYFVISVPVTIFESNCKHLGYDGFDIVFSNGRKESSVCVVRSKRDNQADQLQVSMLNMDGPDFVTFRRLMKTGTYFILIKCKTSMKYHAFGINASLLSSDTLAELNNHFYKAPTNTVVNAEAFNSEDKIVVADPIPEDLSVEQLGSILAAMYNNPDASLKTTGIHMFGLKYGNVIAEKGYSCPAITAAAGIPDSYSVEVNKGVNIYKAIANNTYGIRFFSETEDAKPVNLPALGKRTRTRFPLNCILYGAPGTGKTYATAQYALAIAENKSVEDVSAELRSDVMSRYNKLVEDGQIVFTTFHQNYGYEDFIQGIRPDTSAKEMSFKTVDGVFKVIADRAMKHPEKDYVIIIDEINRANISKVFGELITLIENDKRWGEENAINATLPSGESFAVPNNLYIVGTMNSADKSISLIDTALRRRFDFVEYVPNLKLVSDDKLRAVLETLNKGIATELNSTDLLVGHSYFMGKTADDLCDIMNRSIIPLLYEYFFDNHKKVEAQIKKAIEGMDVEIESSSAGRIKLVKKGAE